MPQENFIFSTSFDQYLKGLDATNGSEFVNVRNLNRCYFTAMVWDTTAHELILGDEKGWIGVWNVYHEKPIFWGQIFNEEKKILGLALRDSRRELIVATETIIEIFYMKREQSSHDLRGHTGPIIEILAQESHKIHRIHSNDKPRFITTSVDNTIRVWDFGDLSLQSMLKAPARSEITCMTFLKLSNLIATGHEDGHLMLWNIEFNASCRITREKWHKHSNTVTAVTRALHRDFELLISTGYDARICIWEIVERSAAIRMSKEDTTGISVYPNLRNSFYAYGNKPSADEVILMQENKELYCIIFHKGFKYIITAGNSAEILIFDIQTLDKVGALYVSIM